MADFMYSQLYPDEYAAHAMRERLLANASHKEKRRHMRLD
jgi:hypothetical protein